MAKTNLTEITVKNLKPPPKGQATYWDTKLPTFGCRISQGGTRAWVVKTAGRYITIGRWPTISLVDARSEAKRLLYQQSIGKHRPVTIRYDDAVSSFLDEKKRQTRPVTATGYKRLLSRHFPFGRTKLSDISKPDILVRLDHLADKPGAQSHALVAAKVFFTWAVRRGYLENSPCQALQSSTRAVTRSRVLTHAELTTVWQTAVQTPYPFGPIIQLLILTGQRRSEIGQLQWDWIDLDERTLTIPAQVAKNRREHLYPYAEQTARILGALPHIGEYLFPATRTHVNGKPTTVFNGWPKATEQLREQAAIPHFTLHDLRRTYSSGLASLGIAPHVIEQCLNHMSGQISGVAATYNRYQYLSEKRHAAQTWEAHLARVVSTES